MYIFKQVNGLTGMVVMMLMIKLFMSEDGLTGMVVMMMMINLLNSASISTKNTAELFSNYIKSLSRFFLEV